MLVDPNTIDTGSTGLLNCGPSLRGWSHQEQILVCPYRWALGHLGSERGIPADPLVKGALVHVGLAHYWSQRMGVPGLLDPVTAVQVMAAQEDRALSARIGYSAAWQKHAPLAMQAVRMYVESGMYEHLRPVAIEYHVSLWAAEVTPGVWSLVQPPPDADARLLAAQEKRWLDFYRMGSPWLTTFRADAIAQLPDGKYVIIDHKTGYKMDARKQNGFRSSGQMLQYQLWGPLAYGRAWDGVHIGFVNLGMLDKGAKAALASFRVASRPEAVATFPQAVCQRAEMLRTFMLAGERSDGTVDLAGFPRAFREQGPCADRYGNCDFFDVCVGAA